MSHRVAFRHLQSLANPNPRTLSVRPLPQRQCSSSLANSRDSDADTETPGVYLSDDDVENLFEDLDALKARLSLVEESLSTIEARVEQLDTKLVGLCDSDLERSILVSELLQEREDVEQEREKRPGSVRKKSDESRQPTQPAGSVRKKSDESRQPTQPAHPAHLAFDTSILSHPFHSNKQAPQPPPPETPGAPIKKTNQDHEREKTERAWQQYRGSFTIRVTYSRVYNAGRNFRPASPGEPRRARTTQTRPSSRSRRWQTPHTANHPRKSTRPRTARRHPRRHTHSCSICC